MKVLDIIPIEELVEKINDNIDIHISPMGEIHPINDEDWWDKLGEYLGGSLFRNVLLDSIQMKGTQFFIYDNDTRRIHYFRHKKDILNYFGIDNIMEMICDE